MEALQDQPIWIIYGIGCLSAHTLFYVLFAHVLPNGPWKELPSFTAHQVVALISMGYATVFGIQEWWFSDQSFELDPVLQINENGLYLARIVIGSMLLWDIPAGFLSQGMGDLIMHLHHVGMLLTAGITVGAFSSQPIGSCYASFFFGVIELSSIPLAIVDLFHPKQKAWYEYHLKYPLLKTLNEICRILFAVLFILVRAILFPFVTLTQFLPNCYQAVTSNAASNTPALWLLMILSLLFTALQMYWGTLVLRQVAKVVLGGPEKKKDN